MIVDRARAWIGTPYVDRQSVRGVGCDCLGLIRGLWRETHGAETFPLPPYSADWGEIARVETLIAAADRHLRRCRPEPGAVAIFRMRRGAIAKHCGVWTGATLIHAREGLGVIEEAWTEAWARRCVGFWRGL